MPSNSNTHYHLIGNKKRYDIFDSMSRTMKHMNRLFDTRSTLLNVQSDKFIEKNGKFIYKINIPKEYIRHTKLETKNYTLSIKYNHKKETKKSKNNSSFYSSSSHSMSKFVTIPVDADIDSIKASYKKGVLSIILNKQID
jgi:HSP20 family molecular chaperone IbpA